MGPDGSSFAAFDGLELLHHLGFRHIWKLYIIIFYVYIIFKNSPPGIPAIPETS